MLRLLDFLSTESNKKTELLLFSYTQHKIYKLYTLTELELLMTSLNLSIKLKHKAQRDESFFCLNVSKYRQSFLSDIFFDRGQMLPGRWIIHILANCQLFYCNTINPLYS